ncbi:MAG: beta-galactosidase [Clostridia bacterium]|nr:beta-galactosidase [Clostridia bacterium]
MMSNDFIHQAGFLHGGDYNPDQWLDRKDILEEDIRLMHQAHVNCVSVGIFSWTRMEPREGEYDFEWLDEVIDRLWKGGIHVILATPSGAKPAWMARRYPEVLRVNERRERLLFGERQNHCLTSPVYREKVRAIDTALAERYAAHPAVILWHISNEFGGTCHCENCQAAFRNWLRKKYGTLQELNRRWCTGVWNQWYTEWEQVESPSPLGEMSCVSLRVDWQRFMSETCADFIRMEKQAVQSAAVKLPVTANLMERFWDYDYFALAETLDVVSWDSYPEWHSGDDIARAAEFAMNHDIMRSLKKAPFLLMESTPSQVNWKNVNKLKKPGMHTLSSLQAVAHGSDSVQYFQWRKCVGGPETFHGAVVSHNNRADTRVFRDVTQVGEMLERLRPLAGTPVQAKVCIIFDWNCRWAVDFAQAGLKGQMRYFDTVNGHYRALWEQGISVDFCDMRACTDLEGYSLVIAPMLFMLRNDFEKKLKEYVSHGGTLVMSYFSGLVDDTDLAFMGDTPHGLTEVLGLRVEEMDALHPSERNHTMLYGKQYEIADLCELCVPEGAETMAAYQQDFYRGLPVITRNHYGEGQAYYIAARVEQAALNAFYGKLAGQLALRGHPFADLPRGVTVTVRGNCFFVQNYSGVQQTVHLPCTFTDTLEKTEKNGPVALEPNGILVLTRTTKEQNTELMIDKD